MSLHLTPGVPGVLTLSHGTPGTLSLTPGVPGTLTFGIPPEGGGGGDDLTLVHHEILGLDSATWTVSGLDLSSYLYAKIIIKAHATGTNPFDYTHTFLQFNGDTTVNNYAWSVKNTDSSTDPTLSEQAPPGSHVYLLNPENVLSNLGATMPDVHAADALLVGHAPSSDAIDTQIWGTHEIDVWFPGETGMAKNVKISNLVLTDFASYGMLNPIQMIGGGFWKGPDPVTSFTFQCEAHNVAAGSEVYVLGQPKS